MSFNNLVLPDILIADLYKNTLLQMEEAALIAEAKPVQAEKEKPALSFLGKHLKKTTIFVYYEQDLYLPDTQLNFLANVLKACNLTIADIAIINLAKQPVTAQEVISALAPAKMIFFDLDPATIKLDGMFAVFSVKTLDGISVLQAPSLEKLNQNNEEGKLLKSKLWLCLKDLFIM